MRLRDVARESKIGDSEARGEAHVRLVDEDVGRLEVAVHDRQGVRVQKGHRACDLGELADEIGEGGWGCVFGEQKVVA